MNTNEAILDVPSFQELSHNISTRADRFSDFAKILNLEVKSEYDERFIKLPPEVGKGTIRSINFPFGVNVVTFKGILREKATISRNILVDERPLRLIYMLDGKLRHVTSRNNNQYELTNQQVSLVACSQRSKETIEFEGNVPLNIVLIQINRSEFMERIDCELELLPKDLSAIFRDLAAEKSFRWKGRYGVSIAQCLEELVSSSGESTIGRYYIEAKVYEILSHQFKQMEANTDPNKRDVFLRSEDIELIKQGKELLVEKLEDAPTILQLSKMVGVNQQKFKKGFKQLFDITPYQYLRNTRLNKSRLLLAEGSLSIGEVAERVGYSNKSHFARRFKEKFGLLPSVFIKQFQAEL